MNRIRMFVVALVAAAIVAPVFAATAAPKRLVFKDEFVVEGEVQKPEVAVFISRQNLNKAYDLELAENFLDNIVESVEKAPF